MNYLTSNIIKYVIILTAVAFFFFPIWWMFITSMKPQLEVMYYPPKFLPPEITFKYYFDSLHWEAGHSIKNSFMKPLHYCILFISYAYISIYSLVVKNSNKCNFI